MKSDSVDFWLAVIARKYVFRAFVYLFHLTLLFASAQMAQAKESGSDSNSKFAPGFLNRIEAEARGNSRQWVEKFCELAFSQKGDDYSRFVRLVRREATPVTFEERLKFPPENKSFLSYFNGLDRRAAFQCLTHGAEGAPADVIYYIYLLHGKMPPNWFNPTPDAWLRKAAYAGSADAQVDFAFEIQRYLYRDSLKDLPIEFVDEVTGARYHFWIKNAAGSNLPRGMYELARLHRGYFFHKWAEPYLDVDLALQMLKRVYGQNQDLRHKSMAAADLGELYFNGKLLPTDYREALKWFEAVDEGYYGHCRAPLRWVRGRLIEIFEEGLGVEKKPEKVQYFMRTAGLGC